MELNNRKLAILSSIAKSYLKTGEPVGSKSLVSELGGAVSSATIRNDMADLERQGLLYQPHTSAGRIPTTAGLKLYIDRLMERRRLSRERRSFIDSLLSEVRSVEGAIAAASAALADCSKCVSFSTAPVGGSVKIRQIDFLRTGKRTIVFVILTATNIVKSSLVRLDSDIGDQAFDALEKSVREKLTGRALCDITPPFVQTMAAELPEYSLLFSPFYQSLLQTVSELTEPEICIKGQDNLLFGNSSQLDAARALEMLYSDRLTDMLIPSSSGSVSVIIPDMSESLDNAALIYSGYSFSDGMLGSIGVLGPYRLDYSTIIPMIEYFSASLENMLKSRELDK